MWDDPNDENTKDCTHLTRGDDGRCHKCGHCEHEWGDERILPAHPDRSTGDHDGSGIFVDRIARGSQPAKAARGAERSQGQFCQKCNAWSGSLGLEPTPDLFIQHIVQVFAEIRRVLRKDGTLWLNLGSSYAGGTRDYNSFRRDKAHVCVPRVEIAPGFKAKDLVPIPWMVAMVLQQDGWYLRSDVIWSKPNPMPESVTDRPTRSHEYVFLLTKSAKYFYDADAVRENKDVKGIRKDSSKPLGGVIGEGRQDRETFMEDKTWAGRNLRSVWTIPTQPFPQAHFATFPEKLASTCIKAGTSQKGCCPECGSPWVRVVEKTDPGRRNVKSEYPGEQILVTSKYKHGETGPQSKTIGWEPSCKHVSFGNEFHGILCKPIPCTVLDPFAGSCRALIVAKKLGRRGIGIDLKAEYLEMSLKELAQEVFEFK